MQNSFPKGFLPNKRIFSSETKLMPSTNKILWIFLMMLIIMKVIDTHKFFKEKRDYFEFKQFYKRCQNKKDSNGCRNGYSEWKGSGISSF